MSRFRRIVYKERFIQSRKLRSADYIAWASKDRLDNPLALSIGDVYFDVSDSEAEAINQVKSEIDSIDDKGNEEEMMTERICKNCQYYRDNSWCSNSKGPLFFALREGKLSANQTCKEFTQRGKKAPLWMRATNKVLSWLKAVSK